MSKVIDAVYENGVFKPLEKVRLKNKQQVHIKIINDEESQIRFDSILKSIRSKAAKFTSKEIEADIEEAIREVRQARRAR